MLFVAGGSLGSKTDPRRINRKKIGDRIEEQFTLEEEFQQTSPRYDILEVSNKLLQSTARGDHS